MVSVICCAAYSYMLTTAYNNYWLTSALKTVLFLGAPIVYYRSVNFKIKQLFSINKFFKLFMYLALGTFAVIICGYLLLYNMFDRETILSGLFNQGITKTSYPFVFANIVFVNAFLEEFFFRGFVFLGIYNLGYKRFSHIFSSILFSLYHVVMVGNWFSLPIFALCIIGLVLAGIFFNTLDTKGQGILGGLVTHIGANLAINLIGAYLFYFK